VGTGKISAGSRANSLRATRSDGAPEAAREVLFLKKEEPVSVTSQSTVATQSDARKFPPGERSSISEEYLGSLRGGHRRLHEMFLQMRPDTLYIQKDSTGKSMEAN
jgi:hypothetical protein